MRRILIGTLATYLATCLGLHAANITWSPSGGGNWDTGTANWTGDRTTFVDDGNDNVTFNKTVGGTITISANMTPASTTVSAASGGTAYTFSGGPIDAGPLAKSGTGTLILNGANGFSSVTISAGTLSAQNVGALGSGAVNLVAGATLSLLPSGVNNYGNAINITGAGTATIDIRPSGSSNPLQTFGTLTIGNQQLTINEVGSNGGTGFQLILGNIVLNGSPTFYLTAEGSGNATTLKLGGISQDVAGRAITVTGNSVGNTMVITNAGSYSGGTTVSAGILEAATNYALGSGAVVVNGGTLQLDVGQAAVSSADNTTPLGITLAPGAKLIMKCSAGAVYSNNITTSSGSGTITISSGVGAFGMTNVLGNLVTGGAQTLAAGSGATGYGNNLFWGAVALGGNTVFNVPYTSSSQIQTWILGAVSESGGSWSLTKTGTGTLKLNAASSYSGGSLVGGGTTQLSILEAAADYALGSGGITVNASGQLTLDTPRSAISSADNTTPLPISLAAGTGDDSTRGVLNLVTSGTSKTFSNAVTIVGTGTAAIQNTQSSGSFATIGSLTLGNQTVDFRYSGGGSKPGFVISGTTTLTNGIATFNLHAEASSNPTTVTNAGPVVGSGGLAITDSNNKNTLSLAAANTYSGDTRVVSSGTKLQLGNSLALQNSTLDYNYAGTVDFGALTAATFGGLKGATNLALPNNFVLTVGNNGQNVNYDGQLSGTGAQLIKSGSGTWTLNGSNIYTGATTVNGGTLLVNGWLAKASPAVTVGAGGTLGGTGTIQRAVTVQSGGTLRGGIPGTASSLTIVSNVTLNAGAVLACDVVNGAPSTINILGSLTLPSVGTVTVNRVGTQIAGAVPLITASNIVGSSIAGWTVPDTVCLSLTGTQLLLRPRAGFIFMVD